MLTHVSPPTRFFTQAPNELIRHPRLGSDAVRLLLWVLSLPSPANLSLSEAAQRAGIKNAGFQRAKRELEGEGYVHEWRRQGARGRWSTTQLASNVPLTADEAAAIRDGFRPSPVNPAVGEPRGRSVGGSPTNTGENTYHPPAQPSRPEPEPQPGLQPDPTAPPHPLAERGALAIATVSHRDRRLRLTGQEVRQLAPLAGEWLLRGASVTELHEALTSGLPEPVHHPASLLRDRLVRKMPEVPSLARQRAMYSPPLKPRTAQMRECRGEHTQPLLFVPENDEPLCRDCRQDPVQATATAAAATTARGAAAVRAALRR